jgi:hypothetical protein
VDHFGSLWIFKNFDLGLFWVPRVIQAFGFGTHFGFLCFTQAFGCGPLFGPVGFKVRVLKLSLHLFLGLQGLRFRVLKSGLGLF